MCWRCGRIEHAAWCSMPGGCSHCGWDPHRWWCAGPEWVSMVEHGSPTGAYALHYRRGEKPCDPCRVAVNAYMRRMPSYRKRVVRP